MAAKVCIAIIILIFITVTGCVIFGAVDYYNTLKWIEQQKEYLREMEKKEA